MKILIVAATPQEIALIVDGNPAYPEDTSLLTTGVGMTATAFHMGRVLATMERKPDLLLNVGIAGSFDPAMEIGSIVQVMEDTFAELGAEDHDEFISLDQMGFGEVVFKSSWSNSNVHLAELSKVKGITVNKVHGSQLSIDKLLSRLSADTESMEGAAFYYAAAQYAIPAMQIRAVSNWVETRNKQNWNIPLAIHNLNGWLDGFLRSMKAGAGRDK